MQRAPPRLNLSKRAISIGLITRRFIGRHDGQVFPKDLSATVQSFRTANQTRQVGPGRRRTNQFQEHEITNVEGLKETLDLHHETSPIRHNVESEEAVQDNLEQWERLGLQAHKSSPDMAHANTKTIRAESKQQKSSLEPERPLKPSKPSIPATAYGTLRLGRYIDQVAYPNNRGSVMLKRILRQISRSGDARKRFDEDVEAVAKWMQLTPAEMLLRQAIFAHIQRLLAINTDDFALSLYGSTATGLATSASDMDIKVRIPSIEKIHATHFTRHDVRFTREHKLREFARILKASESFGDVHVIYATTPLVKATHKASGTEIQLVVPRFDEDVSPLVNGYMDEFPNLLNVYLMVRATLSSRAMTTTVHGGLSSYPLFMMVVAFMKLQSGVNQLGPADAFKRFLRFYADFNTSLNCLSVEPPLVFRKRSNTVIPSMTTKEALREDPEEYFRWQLALTDARRPYMLCLQDPGNRSNNLGKNAYRFMDVRETFRVLVRDIDRWITTPTTPEKQDSEGEEVINEAHPLFQISSALGPIHDRRVMLSRWATSLRRQFHQKIEEDKQAASTSGKSK